MKKFIIILLIIFGILGISLGSYFIFFKEELWKEPVTTVIETTTDNKAIYGSFVDPKEFVKEITDGELLDSELVLIDEYPTKEIDIYYLDSNKDKQKTTVKIDVIDEEKPIVMNARTITTIVGEDPDFEHNVMIGDNADRNPKIDIIGDYDINKIGTYSLKYLVTDEAGNQTEQWFKLNIVASKPSSPSSPTYNNYYFDSFKNDYKNDSNSLGIDVSKWQGEINWKKVKDAGCEFAVIRVGYQYGKDGELKVDPYFEQNIKGANDNKIPVGIYFYSYAASLEDATNQAKWVTKQLKKYDVELPIAFDWENWTSFSTYDINFLDLNLIADTFIKEVEKENYEGMLYSSKSYLDTIWNDFDAVWLAHYTKETNYTGDYIFWQVSNIGKISGISGDVDLDIMYKK